MRRLSKVKPIIKSIGFSGPGGQWSASVLELAENQVNKRKSYANANRLIISPSMLDLILTLIRRPYPSELPQPERVFHTTSLYKHFR